MAMGREVWIGIPPENVKRLNKSGLIDVEVKVFKYNYINRPNDANKEIRAQFVGKTATIVKVIPGETDESGCVVVWISLKDNDGQDCILSWRLRNLKRKKRIGH